MAACLLGAVLLTGSLGLRSVQAAGLSRSAKLNLDRELDQMVGNTGTGVPGLGVVVYKDGRKVYSKFAGRSRIDPAHPAKDAPVTADTRFRVASVSKQFTAFTIMQLVDQGKLKLDDDASRYLGFKLRNPDYPSTPITIRMLLSHTSSVRDGDSYSSSLQDSLKEFFDPEGDYWEDGEHFAPEGQAPGKYFTYANLNYGILGTIIESVTGQRFDLYQKQHILKQLDITGDYVVGNLGPKEFANLGGIYRKCHDGEWDEYGAWYGQCDDYQRRQPPADSVSVYDPQSGSNNSWHSLKGYKPGTNATCFSPQGGLRISYNELEHCLQMLINGGRYQGQKVVRPDLLKEMFTIQWRYDPRHPNGDTCGGSIEAYGLGEYPLFAQGTSRPSRDYPTDLFGHTGEAYGLMAGIFIRPQTQDGFLYMMNGTAVQQDGDARSLGKYSGNYIWEEEVMNAVCKNVFHSK